MQGGIIGKLGGRELSSSLRIIGVGFFFSLIGRKAGGFDQIACVTVMINSWRGATLVANLDTYHPPKNQQLDIVLIVILINDQRNQQKHRPKAQTTAFITSVMEGTSQKQRNYQHF